MADDVAAVIDGRGLMSVETVVGQWEMGTAVLLTRFWDRVLVGDECWLWGGPFDAYGYGALQMGGRLWKAHRLAYHLWYDDYDPTMKILHSCDNPSCVRPDHLRQGTQTENMADMNRRGRNGHRRKTHCKRGHAYDETNTRVRRDGGRECRTCERLNRPGHRA